MNWFFSRLQLGATALCTIISVFCATNSGAAPIEAVATTTMVADLIRVVGGDRVNVSGLMGPGVDPHLYKPTASDVTRLQKAQVVYYNGLLLEGRLADLLERLGKRGKKVFAVADAIPQDRLLKPPQFEGSFDPHVWGDAEMWAGCADRVAATLSEIDPAGKAEFESRASDYNRELAKLHVWAKEQVAKVEAGKRVLVTSHDAFNYFGRAYGFEVIGVQGISTVTEAGLADIAKVSDLVLTRGIKAIFVESSVSRATIDRISKDSGAKVGGELFSDALGTSGKNHTIAGETYDEGTYVGMLKHNVLTAVEALK